MSLELFTSRYAAKKLILSSGLAPIGISNGRPRFPLGYKVEGECHLLKPNYKWLGMTIEEYEPLYTGQLHRFGGQKILNLLQELSEKAEGKGLVLLCYEDLRKTGEWCHRRMFARWWQELTGQEVPELVEAEKPRSQGQMFLF